MKNIRQWVEQNTMFYFPFRETGDHCKAVAAKELAKQFNSDMQPETVLFLRKLQEVILWYPCKESPWI